MAIKGTSERRGVVAEREVDARPNRNGNGGAGGIETLKTLLRLKVNDTNEIRMTVVRLSKGAVRLDMRQWYRNADEEKITHPGKGVMIPITAEVMRAIREATKDAVIIADEAKAKAPKA